MKPLRLFFAVRPPEALRERLWKSLAPLRRARPGVRWTAPELYHVTLRFLGDTAAARVPALQLAADGVAKWAPFRVRLTGTGVFPPRGTPRVYWVGVTSRPLARLRSALDSALAQEGVAPARRPFTPHLTVGRSRPGRRAPAAAPDAGDTAGPAVRESFTVRALHLVGSELFPDGPRYANVHEVVLAGG